MADSQDPVADEPEPRSATLRGYIGVVRRRKLPILLCLVVPIVAAITLGVAKPKLFEGTAQVVLNRQNLANALTNTPDPAAQANDFLRVVQTQADIARAPGVAVRVVRAVPEAHLTVGQFLRQSSVSPARDADILSFHAWNGKQALAVRLTNAYAEQFVEYRRGLDTTSLERARTQLEQRIKELQRDPKSNVRLIAQLASKEQELRTLEALQTSNATVTARARSAAKISPRPLKYLVVAILAGLVLAAVVAWTLEALDTRVRSAEEIEEFLGVPVIARIAPPAAELDGQLVMVGAPRGPAAEAFRMLRTNLQFAGLDRDVKSIMVTSSVEREGKSTTIANLAVAMARAGSNVVLVDLDLRRPTLQQLFDLPPGAGVTDVALGRTSLDDALYTRELLTPGADSPGPRSDRAGRLEILRSGPLPPDPGEFVTSPSVAGILASLRDRADFVLVDAPPVLQTGDAVGLSGTIDGVFLVVRLPVVRRPMLEGLRRSLAASQAPVLGVVLTGEHGLDDYGYGHGYAYGYGGGDEAEPGVAHEAPATPQHSA